MKVILWVAEGILGWLLGTFLLDLVPKTYAAVHGGQFVSFVLTIALGGMVLMLLVLGSQKSTVGRGRLLASPFRSFDFWFLVVATPLLGASLCLLSGLSTIEIILAAQGGR